MTPRAGDRSRGCHLAAGAVIGLLSACRPPAAPTDPGDLGDIARDAGARRHRLTVEVIGPGSAQAAEAAIRCPGQCDAEVLPGARVHLTATAAPGQSFQGWSGACGGTGGCAVTVTGPTALAATFGPADVLCVGGWRWENPAPQGRDLTAVYSLSTTDAWAVGAAGAVLRFDGAAWRIVPSGTRRDLRGVWARRADDVWIVGAGGTILHHDGASLRPVASGTDQDLLAVAGGGGADVWAVGARGTALHHDGRGVTAVSPGVTDSLVSVWAGADGEAWAASQSSPWLLHHDATEGWTRVANPISKDARITGLAGTARDAVWAAVGSGALLRYDGARWATAATVAADGFTAVWSSAPDDVWISGAKGVYHYDGARLTGPTPTGRSVSALAGSSPRDLWGVGWRGAIVRWDGAGWTEHSRDAADGDSVIGLWGSGADALALVDPGYGATSGADVLGLTAAGWTRLGQGQKQRLFAIWGSGADEVWVAADGGGFLRRAGGSWSAVAGGAATPQGLWGSGARDIWAVGYLGGGGASLRHYDGTTWSEWPARPKVGALYAVWGTSPTDAWAATREAYLHFDGSAWTVRPPAAPGNAARGVYGLWGSGPMDYWAVGTSGFLAHYTGGDFVVSASPTKASLSAVAGRSSADIWAVGAQGTVLRYDGVSWIQVDGGALPPVALLAVSVSATEVRVAGVGGLIARCQRP